MVKSKLYEITSEIVGNMKEGWMSIKGCHVTDDMRTNNVLISMVVSNSTLNLGRLIGVNPRILSRGQGKKMQLEKGSCKKWATAIQ